MNNSLTAGGIRKISEKTFNLAQHVYRQLCSYKHSTGIPVAKVYCKSDFSDILLQGGIVNFNLVRPDGSVVGYNEVLTQLVNRENY